MDEMNRAAKRNPLVPWAIGVVIILIADYFVAERLFSADCQAPDIIALGVVAVIPLVYLILMYLTLTSQE
jgi:heme/copper-type cytochrome/quinol oxidase subunit 4